MATYSAVVSLNARFSAILHLYDAALPPNALKFIELVYKELKSFGDFVERLDSRSRERMSASLQRVKEEALEVLDDVNEYKNIIEKSNSLMEAMKKTKEEYYKLQLILQDEIFNVSSSSSSKMVGFCDVRTELKVALIASPLVMPSYFLSLYGMAGIGKTTLARDVFQDLDISEWFECRAWVRVGLERKPQDFTQAILAQLNPADQMVMGGDEAQRLNQLLNDKRCLVVLDDVWEDNHNFHDDDWYRFFGELHGNSCESRVLITSRIIHTDYTRDSRYWCPIQMRLLNKEESWELLREKAFAGGSCPPQLEKPGKEIAERCDGLPLTILTVAHLLSNAHESLWIDVAAQRKHQLFVDAYDQISEVLYPSYKELIDELKLCFLYMAVFPLKSKIRRTKLINLWAVEQIFDPTVNPSTEHYHHDLESLKSLDFSSLLMVYENSSTYFGKPPTQAIRTCGLHSSWWHFCQREARKTNFFYVLDCPEDGLHEEGIKGQTRLSIHHNVLFARKDVYNSMEENCATSAESLLCFGPYHQYEVPICFGLKLLQRLDALNIRFYDFPLEVLKLVELRYLALTCNGKLHPSISKLRRLQFLTVHPHLRIKSSGAPSYMPAEIWDLEELKHLHVLGSDLPDLGDKSLGMLSTLLDVSTASCNVLYRLPNLKKLKIRIELTPDASDPSCVSDHISNMINLESFKCVVVNPGSKFDQVVPPVASFPVLPSSLKKLSLSGMGYPWEEMREIALLPCLQQLKLRCNAFQGQNWQVEEGGFPSLYFLLIEDIDLVKLVGSFRSLKHLSIKHCYKLEEIQVTNFKDVSMIELVDSNPLVEKSIKTSILVQTVFKGNISVHYSWKSARESTPFRWWLNAHKYI